MILPAPNVENEDVEIIATGLGIEIETVRSVIESLYYPPSVVFPWDSPKRRPSNVIPFPRKPRQPDLFGGAA